MKSLFLSVLFLTTFISCNTEDNTNAVSADNERLVKLYFEHFNKHDWKAMAALYSEKPEFKDPSLAPGIVLQTREQIIAKYSELSQTFPDVQDKVLSIYPSGDKHIIVEFVSSGTAPDGSKFVLPICTIFKFQNGLISQDFTYYDNFEGQ